MTETPEELPGVIPSPNIWTDPDGYEVENLGVDPDGLLEKAIRERCDWTGRTLLDIGCGTGFHLPRFAVDAAQVIGVEPHLPLYERAVARVSELESALRERITVHRASAEALPLADASIEVMHARWAYFFGPGCEPGLAELDRVLRPGGQAFVIDNDPQESTFGRWFTEALPDYDATAARRFFTRRGWQPISVLTRWKQPDRASFERVVRLEFTPESAERILRSHSASEVDYAVTIWHKTF